MVLKTYMQLSDYGKYREWRKHEAASNGTHVILFFFFERQDPIHSRAPVDMDGHIID